MDGNSFKLNPWPWPMRFGLVLSDAHIIALRCADFYGLRAQILETLYINAKVVGRGAFIMKDIDAANLAEVMLGDFHIPLIERQALLAGCYAHISFWDFHHDRVAHRAKGTITCRKFL